MAMIIEDKKISTINNLHIIQWIILLDISIFLSGIKISSLLTLLVGYVFLICFNREKDKKYIRIAMESSIAIFLISVIAWIGKILLTGYDYEIERLKIYFGIASKELMDYQLVTSHEVLNLVGVLITGLLIVLLIKYFKTSKMIFGRVFLGVLICQIVYMLLTLLNDLTLKSLMLKNFDYFGSGIIIFDILVFAGIMIKKSKIQ